MSSSAPVIGSSGAGLCVRVTIPVDGSCSLLWGHISINVGPARRSQSGDLL